MVSKTEVRGPENISDEFGKDTDDNKGIFCGSRSCSAQEDGRNGDSECRLPFSRNLAVKKRDGMIELDA